MRRRQLTGWSEDAQKAITENPAYFTWWYTVKSVGLGITAAVAAYYIGKDRQRRGLGSFSMSGSTFTLPPKTVEVIGGVTHEGLTNTTPIVIHAGGVVSDANGVERDELVVDGWTQGKSATWREQSMYVDEVRKARCRLLRFRDAESGKIQVSVALRPNDADGLSVWLDGVEANREVDGLGRSRGSLMQRLRAP